MAALPGGVSSSGWRRRKQKRGVHPPRLFQIVSRGLVQAGSSAIYTFLYRV
jgi:hypothetical protein